MKEGIQPEQETALLKIAITREDEAYGLEIKNKIEELGESQSIRQTHSVDKLVVNL